VHVINALFHSKSSDKDVHHSGDQGIVKLLGTQEFAIAVLLFVIKPLKAIKALIILQPNFLIPVASASTDSIGVTTSCL